MKSVSCWQDLELYGFHALTGESCGLMYRVLCDLTAAGQQVAQKCFGVPRLHLAEPWNRGDPAEPHVGSFLLSPEMLVPLAVFALLESGCSECWVFANGGVLGVEPSDSQDRVELCRRFVSEQLIRTLRYGGTAGDRNVHLMTGRITLEPGPHWTFLVRAANGANRLVQHDTDFARVAQTFGWTGIDDISPESVWDAYEFLEENLFASVDDPGYF
jgi:hypothetical protein